MKIKQRLIFLVSVALIAAVILIVYYSSPRVHHYYNSFGTNIPEGDFSIGIDISHYQGQINWKETDTVMFGKDSISFVFIKASEGLNGRDKMFTVNVKGVEKTDIDFSCYHYFHPNKSALDQAKHFVSVVKYAPFTLKPVIDVEVAQDRTAGELVDSVIVFLDYVEQELEVRPLIYTYFNFYEENFKDSKLEQEFFWMAYYNFTYKFEEQENALIWQFSESATVNGIGTPIDMNLLKKDKRNWVRR